MKKGKLNKSVVITIFSFFIIIFLIGIVYSLMNIIHWKKDVDTNEKIKKEIENTVVVEEDNTYRIDFESLKKQNEDTVAYLKVEGTNIDYVVVQGNDNWYYLKHNFNKNYNLAGWIFADYHNTFDGNDKNIVIFGHNTRDGSMFETLKNVLEESWQENPDNLIILFVTETGQYKYQVFSTYLTYPDNYNYYFKTDFIDEEEYSEFLTAIKNRSNHDYRIEVTSYDKILTLTSCIGDGRKRVVLHAKSIENKQKN